MRIVFDSFRQISPKILKNMEVLEQSDKKDGGTYAYQVLLPLYKICEGFAGKVISGKFCCQIFSCFFCISCFTPYVVVVLQMK